MDLFMAIMPLKTNNMTAVEWLIQILSGPLLNIPDDIKEQAKAMEEKQSFTADDLKAAYYAGYLDAKTNHINDAEQYVNQLQYSKSDELKWTRLSDNSSGSPIIK